MLSSHAFTQGRELETTLHRPLFELRGEPNYQQRAVGRIACLFRGTWFSGQRQSYLRIFNQNGGTKLHFLSAWFLVLTGMVYLLQDFSAISEACLAARQGIFFAAALA